METEVKQELEAVRTQLEGWENYLMAVGKWTAFHRHAFRAAYWLITRIEGD